MNGQLNNVLMIDDERQCVEYYLINLRSKGVSVRLITDFQKGRGQVQAHSREYDVIVVDLIEFTRTEKSTNQAPRGGGADETADPGYTERGLAMGRWVLDAIPPECPVLVLTNRDPGEIEWIDEYSTRFATFGLATKSDCPAYEFYDFLRNFLSENGDGP